ncbi:hypothetical protein HAX54_053132 [Datura stramonium]|uniref:Uncharacterized protein n=1 Tax=Datura stramonium TaxID=4076 RepID=A0ABS8SZW0_DATST|nr:hypothetical protein [Datura stramonium]
MSSITSYGPCGDDFKDYDYEDNECNYDEDYEGNKDYGSNDEDVSMKILTLPTITLKLVMLQGIDSCTYSSCDESNSEESDYELDNYNEETPREYSCSSSYYGTFGNEGMQKTTMENLPPLKIQELVEAPTTSSSVQVSLNDKDKGKEGILGAFQDNMIVYNDEHDDIYCGVDDVESFEGYKFVFDRRDVPCCIGIVLKKYDNLCLDVISSFVLQGLNLRVNSSQEGKNEGIHEYCQLDPKNFDDLGRSMKEA